jgi:hypothetical protein
MKGNCDESLYADVEAMEETQSAAAFIFYFLCARYSAACNKYWLFFIQTCFVHGRGGNQPLPY